MRRLRIVGCMLGAIAATASVLLFLWYPRPEAAIDPEQAPTYFADETASSGIAFTYRNGEEADQFAILETVGGGVALLDYDRDGLLDIFVTGGGGFGPDSTLKGHANRLFRNEGGWRFRDVTAEVGLPTEGLFYSHGALACDFNKDGWPDLLVTGYGRMALYENRQGRFVDVTDKAGLRDRRDPHWSTSAVCADLDGDGWPDLFICHYLDWSLLKKNPTCKGHGRPRDVCAPPEFAALLPALYFNRGDGTFIEAAADAGLKPGKALGVAAFDVNGDGKVDLFVANDSAPNHLYVNRGSRRFEEVGALAGVAVNERGFADGNMGIAVADYDGSGFPSLFVSHFEAQNHALYRNLGNGFFEPDGARTGINALPRIYVGFGTGFLDVDRDGAEDLFMANGHVFRWPQAPYTLRQKPLLLRNQYNPWTGTRARFEDISAQGGAYFQDEHIGRGVAFGDLDNDGAIDMVISHTNEPVRLLRNCYPAPGNWIGFRLQGERGRPAIGAKLVVEVDGKSLTRFCVGAGSYLSTSDPRIVVGLGSHRSVARVTVHWPWGKTQSWPGVNLAINRYWDLQEGDAQVREPLQRP